MIDFSKKWVLITGASTGIGKAFAERFAKEGANLILVARNKEMLDEVAADLQQKHAIDVQVITKDLALLEAPQELYDEIHATGIIVDVLVNNAGFGIFGEFHKTDYAKNQKMLMLNIVALMSLTRLFLPDMYDKKSGTIINLSSVAGLLPLPYMASYAASKAFVLRLSEALWEEYRKHGLHILSVCPGPTHTQFFKRMMGKDPDKGELAIHRRIMPEDVVKDTFQALYSNKIFVICGVQRTKINAQLSRVFTHKSLAKLAGVLMRKR